MVTILKDILMEEIAAAVTLPIGVNNAVCENQMEITCLKLMTDTTTILISETMIDDLPPTKCTSQIVQIEGIVGDASLDCLVPEPSRISDGSSSADSEFIDVTSNSDLSSSNIELIAGPVLEDIVVNVNVSSTVVEAEIKGRKRSIYLLDYFPLWGSVSIKGRRDEMEDTVMAVPRFFELPLRLVTGNRIIDGLDPNSIRMPAHFFGVYDGHGGAQVADYCRERIHLALIGELQRIKESLSEDSENGWKMHWEKAFVDCFQKIDDEVGGKEEPLAPEAVGSTAVVAVILSSHIIIANCGDSRAVLCRAKLPMALSIDHKPDRPDEYARIEANGGKVIQWNGYRVSGVLAMSRSIGDRYLKPWVIPEPEVTIIPRSKEDDCLILASDGLWDVLSNEEACDAARRRIAYWYKKNGVSACTHKGEKADLAAQAAADYLSKLALQKGSTDNISVIVVDLKAQRKLKTKS